MTLWIVPGCSGLLQLVLDFCGLFCVFTSFANDDKNQSIDLK